MSSQTTTLADLEFIFYINNIGLLPEEYQGKAGIYAIFDQDKTLQYIGYSRDIYLSLRQHLVRQPKKCHWLKIQTTDRPSRTQLENIRSLWITEAGTTPPGNGPDEPNWTQPIDIKTQLTAEEKQALEKAAGQELEQTKILKKAARRVENEILTTLQTRGLQTEIRFNPKLKEAGLLDLK